MRHRRRSVAAASPVRRSALQSLQAHWPEYLMEAAALGIFMISAGVFTVLVESPQSWLGRVHLAPAWSRAVVGVAMGGTAAGLIYSPWGRRSGAHMNPAITLTYLRLGKIPPWDACFYGLFQCAGGLAGVGVTALILGSVFTAPPVNYVVTIPGAAGPAAAFAGEFTIAFVLMAVIIVFANRPALARFTGLAAGVLIACFVEFESPLSGFGMNPARTLASALPGGIWTAFWIYCTAAPLGMLLAAQVGLALGRADAVPCCKLDHRSRHPCIFCGQ